MYPFFHRQNEKSKGRKHVQDVSPSCPGTCPRHMFGPTPGSVSRMRSLPHGVASWAPVPAGWLDSADHEGNEALAPQHSYLLQEMERRTRQHTK